MQNHMRNRIQGREIKTAKLWVFCAYVSAVKNAEKDGKLKDCQKLACAL